MFFVFSYGASQRQPCVRIGLTHAYLSHVKMTLANAKSVNRQTLENVVRNAASEFTRRTAIASLASLSPGLPWKLTKKCHWEFPISAAIECFKGCGTEGGAILLHCCGSPDPFACSKMSLFYLKTCTPVKGTP